MRNKFLFLTKMSLKKKIASKWFLIANIVIFMAIISLINIDNIINFFGGDFNEPTKILVIDETDNFNLFKDSYMETINYLSSSDNTEIILYENDINKAKKEVKKDDNKILLLINKDDLNYINAEVISYEGIDTITMQVINNSLNTVKDNIIYNEYHITKEMQEILTKNIEITRTRLDNKETDDTITELLSGVIMPILILPFFMLTMFLIQMIGAEINEEKMTKSMEIIISNVSPKAHFFSKILAGNIFVIIQIFLIVIAILLGLGIRLITNSGDILGSYSNQVLEFTEGLSLSGILDKLYYVIPIALILMIVTFIGYSLMAGILASMTTNSDDYQQLQTPIILISTLGYYLSMISFIFDGSTFIRILSYFPFISSLLSPSLLLLGQINIIDIIISLIIMIETNYLLIKYGLRIYKVGILNYSQTGLWKKMFKALKK